MRTLTPATSTLANSVSASTMRTLTPATSTLANSVSASTTPIIRPAASISANPANQPSNSEWNGQFYVSTRNSAYIWAGAVKGGGWIQNKWKHNPAEVRWNGWYLVSTANPAYVFLNDRWNPRP
ncbi:hypothetical protein M011DRAFT_318683 [Sporormia fimetaria CBS 119925]|uniref:Uncharacterized protein n=1 Tax=Sporormia fimetaria CBS 119925 TaxID=1340428 RepID=A0A6A6UTW3_9PLEO|nr:hypothetical protein M011DRAFT_318683 [Sporormia fimetaria CBS 119925]